MCDDCKSAKNPWPTEKIQEIISRQHLSTGSQMRELYSTVNLQTLCDNCITKIPCSVCKFIIERNEEDSDSDDEESVLMEISEWNDEPICSECKERQCYKCGQLYDEEDEPQQTWFGWTICENCSSEYCNNCESTCDRPCSKCEAPCDASCGCTDEED